ncbi:protein kinase [Alienimonas sp. DA493]|uniref:serine/threonine-protein kinase n=1 Tax=Alienimonas sp. DA493 TaxID=3373605 RepID=UPI0037552D7A
MPAAPPDAESFLACLRQSGLVGKAKLAKFLEGRSDSTAKDLAADLVAAKLLTRWQAEKILAGRCRGFRLGSYALLGLLGKGGMSAVYLGEHVVMKRRCAIKVLPAKLVGGGSHLERFMREARAVAALDHPNIVRAYDVASEGEGNAATHFLVMELVEGRSLYDLVKRDGPPSPERVRQIGYEAAKGLAHAHAAGIVHRDVKPGNILLAGNGAVKVTDLGLARGGEDEEHSLTVAHDEKVLGTADYLAPEQALDSHAVDHRADIYGLGCTLYFSLCGHGPFTEGTLTQRLMAHQTQPPTPIETLVEGVPPALAEAIARMLEKKPEDRFQSMDEVADALAPPGAATTPAAPAEPEPPPEPELSDFLANLPAEPSSDMGSGVRSGIRRRSGSKPKSGVRKTLAAKAGALTGREKTPPPGSLGEPPSVAAGGDAPSSSPDAPGSSSGRFDFLGGADLPDDGSDGPGSAPSQTGSGFEFAGFDLDSEAGVGSGPRSGSGVRNGPGSAVGPGSGAGSAVDLDEPDGSGNGLPFPPADATPTPRRRSARGAATDAAEQTPKAKWPWIAAAVLGLLTAIAVAVWVFSGDDDAGMTDGGEPDAAAEVVEQDGPLTVGPDGRFATLAAALNYLEENVDPTDGDEAVVQLPAGVLNERLVATGEDFSFPSDVTIRGHADGTTLRSPGAAPTVSIIGPLNRFTLENLTVDAAGKAVAVEMSGAFTDSRLAGLTLKNVSNTGLLLRDVVSNELVIADLSVTGEGADSGAIAVQVAGGGAQFVTFTGGTLCETAVGFDVIAQAEALTLDGLTIGPASVGVRFGSDGGEAALENVLLKNLTFSDVNRGVVFAGAPAEKSSGLVIADTDFGSAEPPVDPAGHAGRVKSALDADASTGNTAEKPGDDPLDLFP